MVSCFINRKVTTTLYERDIQISHSRLQYPPPHLVQDYKNVRDRKLNTYRGDYSRKEAVSRTGTFIPNLVKLRHNTFVPGTGMELPDSSWEWG